MKCIELTRPTMSRAVVGVEFNFSVLAKVRRCPMTIAATDHIVIARADFYATCSVAIAKTFVSEVKVCMRG